LFLGPILLLKEKADETPDGHGYRVWKWIGVTFATPFIFLAISKSVAAAFFCALAVVGYMRIRE
jgi:hypothetical protein